MIYQNVSSMYINYKNEMNLIKKRTKVQLSLKQTLIILM